MDGTNKTENTEPDICKQVELMLSDYIDQDLEEDKNAMVFNHLDSCSVCQNKHAQIKSLVQSLKQMPVIKPARDLSANLEELLARDKAPAQVIAFQRPQQATRYIFSAAAAILLVILAIYFLTSNPTQVANKGEEVIRDKDSLIAQKNPSGLPTKTNTQSNGLIAENNTTENIKDSFNTAKQQVNELSTNVQGSDSSEEGDYSLIPQKPDKQAMVPNTNIASIQSVAKSNPTPGNNAEEEYSNSSDNDNNMEGSTSIASIFDDNAYDSNLGLGLSKDDDGLFDIKI